MNIRWNKYTWYSRFAAIFLFLGIVPVIAFYIGMRYVETTAVILEEPVLAAVITADPLAGWKTYENKLYGFSFKHPSSISPKAGGSTWQLHASDGVKGKNVVEVPLYDSETGSAEVRIGASVAAEAILHCMDPHEGETSAGVAQFGGAAWTVFPLVGDGIEGTSYRTVRDDTCIVLEVLRAGEQDTALARAYARAELVADTFEFSSQE